jgi:hypothetical protein
MRLRDVTFDAWLRSHADKKKHKERWLRELYPWPVLAQVDCDERNLGQVQRISYDGADYNVTLQSKRWQELQRTYRYRLRVESDGLGWHSRSFSDEYDLCGTADGEFRTLFHAKDEEPLEKIARAFFDRKWIKLNTSSFKTLAVSRFLAASIVAQVAEEAFRDVALMHYPGARLVDRVSPMFAGGSELWIGYRFFSEGAYAWARQSMGSASRVVSLFFANTKYQFRTDLPPGAEVLSIAQLDADELGSKYEEFIRVLLRGLELPERFPSSEQWASIVTGQAKAPPCPILEADVHEALAALTRPCSSKSEFRYQLAAAVVLNAWIEDERRLGYTGRSKFYAFKQKVGALVKWAADSALDGVTIWAETGLRAPILYIRIDNVDFSFQAIPDTLAFVGAGNNALTWSGVRLKPIAPIVLAWARALRSRDGS